MQVRINVNGIPLHKPSGRFIVSLALNALNFPQQFAKQGAQFCIVIHLQIGLPALWLPIVLLTHQLYRTVCMGQCPPGNERPVTHVRLLYLVALLDSYQLGQQPVHQIRIVLTFISFAVRHKSEFQHLVISHVI